ncbi:MAG TPA: DUF4388 domain-containing protein [Mycobacteriales bacterium]|nr:DUF4388 domain-containing protein [Mycobacteriales bacterium]
MLKGDLTATSLATVLRDLADTGATGSLVLNHPDGDEAQILMRSGLVCGLITTNQQSDLGAKLVSSGELAPEALSEALDAQRNDLAAWNLGELLVHLGYVDEAVVQAFVTEQMHEALWDLMRWTEGRWKFRKNAKTREAGGPPVTVVDLLESLRERGYEWEAIADVVDSPHAIPTLSARGDGAPETTLDSDAWSMLCKIDGVRSVAELARDCGYTLFEAGQVLVTLVDAGLVDIADDIEYGDEDVYGAGASLASALSGATNRPPAPPSTADDALSRLTRLASEVTNGVRPTPAPNPLQLDVMAAQQGAPANLTVPIRRKGGESFAASMGRVSGALADALGPAPELEDDINPLLEVRKRPVRPRPAPDSADETEAERRKRLRVAAAAELAEAAAAADSLRPDHDINGTELVSDSPLRLVDLETERARISTNQAEEDARHAAEITAREAAEQFARAAAEQAARHAAEQTAAQQAAAAAAAEQAAAEQAAAEQAAAAQLAAEQAAAERAAAEAAAAQAAAEQAAAAQAAAEQAAAAQLAAEQAAAEQAAAQLAAEQAAAEQAAAEQAAAQLAAEQAAAEQAAAEQAAAEQAAAQAAAVQLAAEQAAAERAAAEQAAAQLAAAQAAAAEAHRLAAAEAEREEQARAATATLAELHHADPPVISVVPDPEPAPAPEPVYEPEPVAPAPAAASSEGADTAALLRELSSLGVEDDPAAGAAAAIPQRPRPQQVDKKAKKKIGLFGL